MLRFIQSYSGEKVFFRETELIKKYCEENHIDFKLSVNNPAYGCRDAASKRFNGTG